MFLAPKFISSLEIKPRKVPRGTDVTLTCPSIKADASSLSVSAPSKSNIRQFYYNETLYIVISDFCQQHKGPYLCVKDDKVSSGTVLDMTELKVRPPALVNDDNIMALTCSVSHLILDNNILLVWVQMNGSSSVPVKSHRVTNMLTENILFMKDINMNDNTTNFTCLVFTENNLVTLLPIKLNYTRNLKLEPTSSLQSNSSPASFNEDTPSSSGINVLRISVRSVISIMILVPFIVCTIQFSRYIGAVYKDTTTSTSNLKGENELYVRFEK
ncbi:uncharacterized protein LOC134935733 [Pseudophryne corroboree]|uniref:uncharacterized protein LOC134935733 n=1 Tax=Pseudophryne corroboree TaxID=495146 RepID=UPI00308184F8